MTAREIAALLDKTATLSVTERSGGKLEVPVRITNAREAWGRIDVLVTPVDGSGEAWVSAERVKVRT